MPTATRPMPDQESSQERSAWSAGSYEGKGSPANPSAAMSRRPRGSLIELAEPPRASDARSAARVFLELRAAHEMTCVSLTRARELDDLAAAEHAHLERGARRHADQLVADLLDVVLRHDGDALDREDDVAAHRDLPPSDGDDPVAPLQAHVPRHRAVGDRLDEEPGGRGDVEDRREAAGE